MKFNLFFVSLFLFAHPLISSAEVIYLNNGDRISGTVISKEHSHVSIQSDAMGVVSIKKDLIERIEGEKKAAVQEEEKKLWSREITTGYDRTGGNTEKSQFSMNIHANRKTDDDEFTTKANVYYSSSDGKMDSQKWYGMLRYAFSFWERKWYNFYKFEGDHDRFSNIDYRLTPSTGVGYWFSDTDQWKAMIEGGIGFEHTNFRDSTKSSNEAILIPRAFAEAKIFDNALLSQEIILYPSLKDTGEYRMHSESSLTSPISDHISLKFSLIDDFNSSPASGVKKNDWRLISSIGYAF